MPDMLVPLLKIPSFSSLHEKYEEHGIRIHRALPPDYEKVTAFAREHFGSGWAGECAVAMCNKPSTCFIATKDKEIVGFGCYEATYKNFFGPTGVAESYRSLGIGKGLLIACLEGLRELGYAYAIVGGAGPVGFYERTVNATVIEDSVPGIYKDMIS